MEIRQNFCRITEKILTPEACAEDIRRAFPLILESHAGESIPDWLERLSREVKRQITPARLRAYWHRRVSRPEMHEGLIIIHAANAALAKRQAIKELEMAINRRAAELEGQYASLNPLLRWLAPRPPGPLESKADKAQAVVRDGEAA